MFKLFYEYDRAGGEIELRRAFDLNPGYAFAWQGEYRSAEEQVRRAADLDPSFFFPPWAYG